MLSAVVCFLMKVIPPLPPNLDPREVKSKDRKVSPLHHRNQKHYKTSVILRNWVSDIDPVTPGHATCAYKTYVKPPLLILHVFRNAYKTALRQPCTPGSFGGVGAAL